MGGESGDSLDTEGDGEPGVGKKNHSNKKEGETIIATLKKRDRRRGIQARGAA